jgi:oligosaccharide repeat unit polymerase
LDKNFIYIVLNSFLYISTYIIYQHRRKYFGTGSFLLLLYTAVGISGIIFYKNSLIDLYDLEIDVKWLSYIYLYVMLMVAAYPILRLKENDIHSIQRPSHQAFIAFCTIMIVVQMIRAFELIPDVISSFSRMLNDPGYGLELYQDSVAGADTVGRQGINIIGVISGCFTDISVLMLFLYLTFTKKSKLFIAGLVLSSLISPLAGLATGQRGSSVRFIIDFIVSYLIFRKHIEVKVRKHVNILISILLLAIAVPFSAITFSRSLGHNTSNVIIYQLEAYLGQSFINFSTYGLDAEGIRNGDRTLTLVKMALDDNTPRNYYESLSKYSYMKMNESRFYTFVGDFTLDYGPLITVVLFLLFMAIFMTIITVRRGRLLFHKVIIIYLLSIICSGFYLYPLAGFGGNIQIIVYILYYLFFKIDYDNIRIKRLIR